MMNRAEYFFVSDTVVIDRLLTSFRREGEAGTCCQLRPYQPCISISNRLITF
jgi:hypothetical protein